MIEEFNSKNFPAWFELPQRYIEILQQGDFKAGDYDIGPSWQLLRRERIKSRYVGLNERYPNRWLYPFARRVCEDDIACFDLLVESIPPKVVVIHDYSSEGWELREEFENFDCWLQWAGEEEAD